MFSLNKKTGVRRGDDIAGRGWGGSGLGGICLLAGQLGDLGSFALAPACSVLSSASRSLTSSNGLCFAPAPLLLPAHGCTLDGSFSGLAATVGVGQSECSSSASCECQGHRGLSCAGRGCAEKPHHQRRPPPQTGRPRVDHPSKCMFSLIGTAAGWRSITDLMSGQFSSYCIRFQGMVGVSCSLRVKMARGTQLQYRPL